jgi:hypothetical protein
LAPTKYPDGSPNRIENKAPKRGGLSGKTIGIQEFMKEVLGFRVMSFFVWLNVCQVSRRHHFHHGRLPHRHRR